MNVPAVSVILPAYNCEKFIGKAIESVLQQTLADFELIILNDGSTDKTESAILAFTDPRIIYLKNPVNKGLIWSLNKAAELAQGKYIARMDADDICLPERLAKQKLFLDANENITVVATTIDFINEQGLKTGMWALDRQTINPEQIRKRMPYENCIAHPTVMIRSEILKYLKYNVRQKNIEDYDLWLRILNMGMNISKINEPLLLYRIHSQSVTSIYLKKNNPFFKHLSTKYRFVKTEILSRRFTLFVFHVSSTMYIDLAKGIAKAFKNLFR